MNLINKRGISLILLTVTIVIMIILSSAIILSIAGDNILKNVGKTAFQNDIKIMVEELATYISQQTLQNRGQYDQTTLYADKYSLEENGVVSEGKNIKDIITVITDEYIDKFAVEKGKIRYIGDDITELQWANETLNGIRNAEINQSSIQTARVVSLKNCFNINLVDYKIYGNSVQNKKTNPDEQVEIYNVGDKTVNLFDTASITKSSTKTIEYNGTEYEVYSIYGYSNPPQTYTTSSNFQFDINLEKNKTYTISLIYMGDSSNANLASVLYMPFLDEAGNSQCFSVNSNTNVYNAFKYWTGTATPLTRVQFTITPTENIVKGALCYHKYPVYGYVLKDSIQIQEGTYATEYEPFGKYKIPLRISNSVYDFDSKKIDKLQCTETTTRYGFDLGSLDAGNYSFDFDLVDDNDIPTYISLRKKDMNGNYSHVKYITTDADDTPVNFQADGTSEYYIIFDSDEVSTAKIAKEYWSKVESAQLQKGDEVVENVSGIKSTMYNIFLDEPLRKVGNAEDYIDFRNGKLVRYVKEYAVTGNESWAVAHANNTYSRYYAPITNDITGGSSNINCISNNFVENSFDTLKLMKSDSIAVWYRDGKTRIDINIAIARVSSVEQLKQWLNDKYTGGTPVVVQYALEKPEIEKIELPKVLLNKGFNNVVVDTKVAPSKVDILYYED